MQLIAGRTAQEYNQRKNRKGAFWEDRYHATAIQTDHHLIRCLIYIDLNMVRARVVCHPRDWDVSGYNEIQCPRPRNGAIDLAALCKLVGVANVGELRDVHADWVNQAIGETYRDPVWTESLAVGDENFLAKMKEQLGISGIHRRIDGSNEIRSLREDHSAYFRDFAPKCGD
jgi:putative transposase